MISHLPDMRGAMRRTDWKIAMTLFYSHDDRLHGSAGTGHHPIMRTLKRVRAGLRMMHRAIAAAKIRRIRNELMLHGGARHWAQKPAPDDRAENDAAKYPRRPIIPGDKWDF
jgi:hypothetical protein